MAIKIILLLALTHCCLADPTHYHLHHNRYQRRRVPPVHHAFIHQMIPQVADFLPVPIIPFENKYPDLPPPNPLVDPSKSIRFRLYTRQNPYAAQEIPVDPRRSHKKTYFDPTKPTKVLIHGSLDSTRDVNSGEWMNQMRLAYLEKEDVNVVVVDYTFYVLLLLYWASLPNTYAYSISELTYNLSDGGKNLDKFHLIGRSWGAHIAGMAGHHLCGKVGRITGLDPANPPFRFAGFQYRLDKRDAKFVDAYHFNGRPRFNIFTAVGIVNEYDGLSPPIGHVDVYPNLRERQATGCPIDNAAIFAASCHLGMGARLFMETIKKNDTFLICPCESFHKYLRGECPCEASDLRYMGEGIPNTTSGVFQMMSKSQVKPAQPPKPAEDLPATSESTSSTTELNPASESSSTGNTITTTQTPVTTEIILSTEASSTTAVPIAESSSSPAESNPPSSATESVVSSPEAPITSSTSASTAAELTTESSPPVAASEASETSLPDATSSSTSAPEQDSKNSAVSEDGQSASGSAIGRKGPKESSQGTSRIV